MGAVMVVSASIRPVVVRLVVLVLPVAALLTGAVGSPARSQVVAPNVVLILTDDQRVGLLPAMPVVRHRIQQMRRRDTSRRS